MPQTLPERAELSVKAWEASLLAQKVLSLLETRVGRCIAGASYHAVRVQELGAQMGEQIDEASREPTSEALRHCVLGVMLLVHEANALLADLQVEIGHLDMLSTLTACREQAMAGIVGTP